MSLIVAVLACLPLAVPVLRAKGEAGERKFGLLTLEGNARAAAMGDAHTALARGAAALHYNPAGLGFTSRPEAGFMHNQYFQGMTQDHLAFSSGRGWGAFLNHLDYGPVQRTTTLDKDATLGQVGGSDLAFGAGYGLSPVEPFALGATMKFMRGAMDYVDTKVLAFDFGGLYLPPWPGLSIGLSAHNLRAETRFENDKKKLPTHYRAGASFTLDRGRFHGTFTADFIHRPTRNYVVGLGAEFIVAGVMPLRFGYTNRSGSGEGITSGLGWMRENWRIDYAIVPFGDLGLSHRVSLTARWGAQAPKGMPPPEAPSPAAPKPPSVQGLPGMSKPR